MTLETMGFEMKQLAYDAVETVTGRQVTRWDIQKFKHHR